MPPARSRRNSPRGTAAVETAIALPVLMLILLGTIEACSMIFLKQSLEIAAYEAARTAIVPQTTAAHAEYTAQLILAERHVSGGTAVATPASFDSLPYGTPIKVAVTAPCEANGLLPSWFYAGQLFTAEVEMMKEN